MNNSANLFYLLIALVSILPFSASYMLYCIHDYDSSLFMFLAGIIILLAVLYFFKKNRKIL